MTDQVTVASGTSKSLKQCILGNLWLGLQARLRLGLPRSFRPQTPQRTNRRLHFIASQMNRQKWQHKVKAVRVAAQQYEIVFVSKRREPWFARVWQVPSPTTGGAMYERGVATGLQKRCQTRLVLVALSRPDFQLHLHSRQLLVTAGPRRNFRYNRLLASHPLSGRKGGSRDPSQRFP
jgi:hypothetical protein